MRLRRAMEAERAKKEAKDEVEIQKSNVVLVGPTGCGKTLLAKSMARIAGVPVAIVDATSLTQVRHSSCYACGSTCCISSRRACFQTAQSLHTPGERCARTSEFCSLCSVSCSRYIVAPFDESAHAGGVCG